MGKLMKDLKEEIKWQIYNLNLESQILYDRIGAFVFHTLHVVTDKFGYLVFGKERWEKAKEDVKV